MQFFYSLLTTAPFLLSSVYSAPTPPQKGGQAIPHTIDERNQKGGSATPPTIDERYGQIICPDYIATDPALVCDSAVFAHCPCATAAPPQITATLPIFHKRAESTETPTPTVGVADKAAAICPLYVGGPVCTNPAFANCPCATPTPQATESNPSTLDGENIAVATPTAAVIADKVAAICPLYVGGPVCTNPRFAHCPCATPTPQTTESNPFTLGGVKVASTRAANGTAAATKATTLITKVSSMPALVVPTQAARLAQVGTVAESSVAAPASTAAPVRGVSGGATYGVAVPGSLLTMAIIEK